MNLLTLDSVDVQLRYSDERLEDMTVDTVVGMAENLRIAEAYEREGSKDFVLLDNYSVDKALKLVGIMVVT